MKKLSIMMLVAILAGYASAVSWNWDTDSFQFIDVAFGTPSDGDGTGWFVEVIGGNTTGGNTSSTPYGWITDFGYYIDSFSFNADEAASVSMKLWNSATSGTGYFLESPSVVLPTGLVAPPMNQISFDFTGQTWQAVPEPATFMMFAMGGIGAWLLRRRNTN